MRRCFFAAGVLTLVAVWFGPLPQLARSSFSAHMTMHMAVVAIAPPLFALGLRRTRFDHFGFVPTLYTPVVASMLELIVVWAWHTPVLHHLARHNTLGLVFEQSTFFLCGLLLWVSAFGGTESSRRGAGVIALLLTSMHMTLLGALLALAPRALYHHTHELPGAAVADQHFGGVIMLIIGGVSYLAGGLALAVSLLRSNAFRTDEARP